MSGDDRPRPEHLAAYFTWEPPPSGLPARFGVVTAHNPDGNVQDAAANDGADAALELMLDVGGLSHFRVIGRSQDGSHQEPGWGIVTDDLEEVRDFCKAFHQLAFFWVEDGNIFLVNADGKLRHPLAPWAQRVLP